MVSFAVPQQNYTVAGNPRTVGPFAVNGPVAKLEATASIPTADYEAAGAGFSLDVQVSDDGFATYHSCGYRWANPAGGPIVSSKDGTVNPAPEFSCTFPVPLGPGRQARAVFTVARNMRVGWAVVIS